MKEISVSVTPPATLRYPLHRHAGWEIMYYTEGEGYMVTPDCNIGFSEGTVLIIPPGMPHGSVSEKGFVNISVNGDFSHLLMLEGPLKLQDNPAREGRTLATLILNNRYVNPNYLAALCTAYIRFLLQSAECGSDISRAVSHIAAQIEQRYTDSDFEVADLLHKSGYAEDYIRAEFRKATGLTPVMFLTRVRIEHACNLLEIYGKHLRIHEVAERCGFRDAVYFSRRFKALTGCAPVSYQKGEK